MADLSPEQCARLLAASHVGHLGVVDGADPYVTPLSYALIDDRIYFRTGPGRRTDALRANPRACFEVSSHDEATGEWESVIVWGEAEEVDDDHTIQEVIAALLAKYREALGSPLSHGDAGFAMANHDVIFAIPVDLVTGRSSGSYFGVRTRPGRL